MPFQGSSGYRPWISVIRAGRNPNIGGSPSSGQGLGNTVAMSQDQPGNGLPTRTAQSWPGSPCGGLIMPTDPEGSEAGGTVTAGAAVAPVGGTVMEVGAGAWEPSNGAPTGISQRWPGSPWGGFSWTMDGVVASGVTAGGIVVSITADAGCSGAVVVVGVDSSALAQEAMAKERASVAVAQVKVAFISGRFRNGVIAEFRAKITWFDRAFSVPGEGSVLEAHE